MQPLGFASRIQDAFGQNGPLVGEDRFARTLGGINDRNEIPSTLRDAFNTLRGGVNADQFNTFDSFQKNELNSLLGSRASGITDTNPDSKFEGTARNIIDLALRAGGINRRAAQNFQFGGGGADLLAEFARSRPTNTGGIGEGGGSNFAQFVGERFDPGNRNNLFNPA